MANKTNNTFSAQYPSGIAFVGSILLGIGIGMLFNQVAVGSLIGTGIGFMLVAVMSMSDRNQHLNR
jgi:hypothetical protein